MVEKIEFMTAKKHQEMNAQREATKGVQGIEYTPSGEQKEWQRKHLGAKESLGERIYTAKEHINRAREGLGGVAERISQFFETVRKSRLGGVANRVIGGEQNRATPTIKTKHSRHAKTRQAGGISIRPTSHEVFFADLPDADPFGGFSFSPPKAKTSKRHASAKRYRDNTEDILF